jgi:hypothetical protein
MVKPIASPIANLVPVLAMVLSIVGCGKKEEPPVAKGAVPPAEVKSAKEEGLPAEVTRLSEETKRYAESLRGQPAGSGATAEQLSRITVLLDQLTRHVAERDQTRQQGGDVSKPEAALAADLGQLQEIQKTLPTLELGSGAAPGAAPPAGEDKPPLDRISENLTKISQIVQQGKDLVAVVRPPKDQSGVPSEPTVGSTTEGIPAPGVTQASDPSQSSAAPSAPAPAPSESPTSPSGGAAPGISVQSSKVTPPLATGGPASCCNIVANPAMKGRLGRLVVAYPDGAKISGVRMDVYKAGEAQAMASGHGNQALDLLPGTYAVVISGKRVEPVMVKSGHDTQVRVGVLRVTAGGNTRVDVLDVTTKATLIAGHGKRDIGLPIGPALVQVAGQSEAVTIESGKITDF